MTVVQEVRIAAMSGLEVPDNLIEGSRITVTCDLLVAKVSQETIDVSGTHGYETMLGGIELGCVATHWRAS